MTEIYRDFLQFLQVYAGYTPKNVQRLISVISLQFPIYSVFIIRYSVNSSTEKI